MNEDGGPADAGDGVPELSPEDVEVGVEADEEHDVLYGPEAGESETQFQTSQILISRLQQETSKKQVTTTAGRAQSGKRSLTGRQIAWMIYDFFKIRVDNDAILELKRFIKSPSKERQRSSLPTQSGMKYYQQSLTDVLTASLLDSLCKMQVEKSEELKRLLQVYAQETSFGH